MSKRSGMSGREFVREKGGGQWEGGREGGREEDREGEREAGGGIHARLCVLPTRPFLSIADCF